jgi:hypothetical protein
VRYPASVGRPERPHGHCVPRFCRYSTKGRQQLAEASGGVCPAYDGGVFIDDQSNAALLEEMEESPGPTQRIGEIIPFAQLVGDLGLHEEVYAALAS